MSPFQQELGFQFSPHKMVAFTCYKQNGDKGTNHTLLDAIPDFTWFLHFQKISKTFALAYLKLYLLWLA